MSQSLRIYNEIKEKHRAHQKVTVIPEATTRETFTLSGWAKGYGLPNREQGDVPEAMFQLRAEIKYKDKKETESHVARFSPCTEEWQLASVRFAKSQCREVEYLDIYCDYSYNFGLVYFDDIQLVRNYLETGLSEGDFEQKAPTVRG